MPCSCNVNETLFKAIQVKISLSKSMFLLNDNKTLISFFYTIDI